MKLVILICVSVFAGVLSINGRAAYRFVSDEEAACVLGGLQCYAEGQDKECDSAGDEHFSCEETECECRTSENEGQDWSEWGNSCNQLLLPEYVWYQERCAAGSTERLNPTYQFTQCGPSDEGTFGIGNVGGDHHVCFTTKECRLACVTVVSGTPYCGSPYGPTTDHKQQKNACGNINQAGCPKAPI